MPFFFVLASRARLLGSDSEVRSPVTPFIVESLGIEQNLCDFAYQ